MSCEIILCPQRYSQSLMKRMKSPVFEEWNFSSFHLIAPMSSMRPLALTSRSMYAICFMHA